MIRVRGEEEKLAAAATVRFVLTAKGRPKPKTIDVLAAVGITDPSPVLGEEIQLWLQAEKRMVQLR